MKLNKGFKYNAVIPVMKVNYPLHREVINFKARRGFEVLYHRNSSVIWS